MAMRDVFVGYAAHWDREDLDKLGEFEGDDHPAWALAEKKTVELDTPITVVLEVRDNDDNVLETHNWGGLFPEDVS